MTFREAIAKCAAQGLLSFPAKKGPSIDRIIRANYDRNGRKGANICPKKYCRNKIVPGHTVCLEHLVKTSSERPTPNSESPSGVEPSAGLRGDAGNPQKRTRYKKPLRGPNFKEQRYVVRP